MQVYITKNNQQLGPFEEAKVLEMLRAGQLSASDLAIRQGENQWQKLSSIYPNFENKPIAATAAVAAAVLNPTAAPAPKKSRKGLLLGCGGILFIGLLVTGILGFLAYRNIYPADSTENLPNSVKDLKLTNRYPPKGNIWGTEASYVGLYSNEAKTETVLYLMTVYANETVASDALRDELLKSCQAGEKPMNFSFIDKNGKELSQGATCAVPLYVQKDNKLAAIGGSGAAADTFIEFAENLPFNSGSTMKRK